MLDSGGDPLEQLARLILKFPRAIAFWGTLLALVGAYFSVLLYKNLRTEVQELLPTTARSVVDLGEVSRRLESIDNLGVLVFSENVRASKRFVVDLAALLARAPKDVIASVDYRIDRELQFFRERQALFIDLADLVRIKKYVAGRISYEKALYNPLNIFSGIDLQEPVLDFDAMRSKYTGKTGNYEKLPCGFYATSDEKKRALLVNMPGGSSGIAGAYRLRQFVQDSIAALHAPTYAADLKIAFTGGVEDQIEEQSALVADLELSTIIVSVVVTLGMLAFFRNVRATLALVISLFMGTLWTFGISYFAVGYLNANSAFLGSIVIGNGINFGIIWLARYLEERRSHHAHALATRRAMVHTATSTWTAASAAALSYGSLMLTGFRGFKQFGVIGLIGMVLCWISAFTLLPAYLTILDGWKPLTRRNERMPTPYIAGALAWLIGRFPRALWWTSILATGISLICLTKFTPKILETDLSKLRNKESMEHGSAYLSKYLDEIFQRFLSPLVVLPRTREHADEIARRLKTDMKREGTKSLIASVQTIDDFIPTQQVEKIRVLHQISALLPPQIRQRLSAADQRKIRELINPHVMHPITQKDLPGLILSKFTEKDGSIGKMVLVEPPLTHETNDGDNLVRLIANIRSTADAVEPGAPVAGTMAISSDMIGSISRDGPRATLFAFIAVVLLTIVLFRNLATISLVLFSLILGVLWLAGLILGLELKINFLNFIALPITFGIGIDYGVNIFHRYREQIDGDILRVVRNTGSAVGLCSFSTIVGYTSLLIAGNQGFVSFGVLAVTGELTCVIAAVISLPSYLYLRRRRRRIA